MVLSQSYAQPARDRAELRLLTLSMIVIFAMFGYAKWFGYEALVLAGTVKGSPLLSWMPAVVGVRGTGYVFGAIEWCICMLLLAGLHWPYAALLGAVGATCTFVVTLSLLFTLPDAWVAAAGGFPAMSESSSFLLKDLVLLAVSLVLLRRAWVSIRAEQAQAARHAPMPSATRRMS